VSCDWSQLVTWYKAAVNSPVPCDLCDHSQISYVVSNDVKSDILLTTLHVITDWPITIFTPGLFELLLQYIISGSWDFVCSLPTRPRCTYSTL
ncbi:unnamed protein product, partial [Staurois parvus]